MSVVTADHRRRLESIQARVRGAREAVQNAEALVRGAGDDADIRQTGETALATARSDLDAAQRLQSALLGQIAGITAAGAGFGRAESSFLDNPAMVSTLEQLAHSSAPIGNLALGTLCSASDVVDRIRTGQWSGGGGMRAADSTGGVVDFPEADRVGPFYGVLPQLRRRLRLLDLIPTQVMSQGSSFHYTQELGSFDTAVETAELAMKSPADVDYEDAEAVAVTIAHWFKASRQSLADVPQLMASLNSRLIYGVFRRLEGQILAGDGTGQNLRGILNTSGIATVAYVAGDPLTDLTLDAITNVIVSDAQPDAVVANPVDVANMLKAKAAGSGERLDSDGAFGTPPTQMWGLPLIQSPVVAQGTALVGDWSQGATLWVREGVNVRSSDSDQDDFTKNRMTLLGEGRFALTVERPVCFAEVHYA